MIDRRLWRGAAVLGGLAAIGAAVWFSPLRDSLDPATLVSLARGHGQTWWAIPAYLALYCILSLFFIPTQALSIAGVLIWGWWRAGIIELTSATVAAIFPYLVARGALRESIAARLAGHQSAARILEREGFTLLLILRVIPVIPYTLLNYVAGLSSLRPGRYVVATAIGMIPATFIFAYFVDAVVQGVMEPREVVVRGAIAGLLLAALVITTRLVAPRVRRRLASRDEAASPTDGADRG